MTNGNFITSFLAYNPHYLSKRRSATSWLKRERFLFVLLIDFHSFSSDYMDQLCALLYDLLRPHIIHSNHLETLAELCFILRVEMIDEHINNNRKWCHGTLMALNRFFIHLFFLSFNCSSRTTRCISPHRFATPFWCAREVGLSGPHLRSKWYHRIQARFRRFGVPGEIGNDGGNAYTRYHV
jgi:hypothetical protein